MDKQSKQVERVMLEEQADGWAVEARVSGLTLEMALALQASIFGVRLEETVPASYSPLVVTVNLPENAGKHAAPDPLPGEAPEPKAKRGKNAPKAVHPPPTTLDAEAPDPEPEPEPEFSPMPPVKTIPGPPPVMEPAPVKKPLVASGEVGDTELVMRLADAPKLRDVIVIMGEAGIRGTDALIETSTRIKDRVPVLSRIGDLKERITRAAEVLGVTGA